MEKLIKSVIKENIKVKNSLLREHAVNIEKSARLIIESLLSGGTLLVFGNGGSAADSQHIVAELVGRFMKERRPLKAVALTTNTSTITALANDYGYDLVFARQVEALGGRGDVALGISTSGNSKNVIEGMKKAKSLGMNTICLTGGNGGKLKKISDISIIARADNTPRIQEAHIMVGHILCELIEKGIFGE